MEIAWAAYTGTHAIRIKNAGAAIDVGREVVKMIFAAIMDLAATQGKSSSGWCGRGERVTAPPIPIRWVPDICARDQQKPQTQRRRLRDLLDFPLTARSWAA
jgi:hypothetical protein